MYTGTNLSIIIIRTSCEACAIKGKGRGALFFSVVNRPLHSWVHCQTPARESILFREWAESYGGLGRGFWVSGRGLFSWAGRGLACGIALCLVH